MHNGLQKEPVGVSVLTEITIQGGAHKLLKSEINGLFGNTLVFPLLFWGENLKN